MVTRLLFAIAAAALPVVRSTAASGQSIVFNMPANSFGPLPAAVASCTYDTSLSGEVGPVHGMNWQCSVGQGINWTGVLPLWPDTTPTLRVYATMLKSSSAAIGCLKVTARAFPDGSNIINGTGSIANSAFLTVSGYLSTDANKPRLSVVSNQLINSVSMFGVPITITIERVGCASCSAGCTESTNPVLIHHASVTFK